MSRTYQTTPIGVARYPWIDKPDTKFNADGIFKVDLVLEGEEAQAFKRKVDAEVERAFAEETEKMAPAARKKAERYYPYEVEEDEQTGEPTGRIFFQFRQNAVIKLKDGSTKPLTIGIYDARDEAMKVEVGGGSKLRVLFAPRNIKIASTNKAGVRLDFMKVQVVDLKKRGGGSEGGFGAVEGGYVHEDDDTPPFDTPAPSAESGSDY